MSKESPGEKPHDDLTVFSQFLIFLWGKWWHYFIQTRVLRSIIENKTPPKKQNTILLYQMTDSFILQLKNTLMKDYKKITLGKLAVSLW